eukprot:gene4767-5947_t
MDVGTEKVLQAIIAVTTNLSCIPLGLLCIKRGNAYEAIIGTACAISSMMYHVGEVFERSELFQLTGLTSGQWHRLDNIFTILVFQALMLFMMDTSHPQVVDLIRWLLLVLTLYCQERAPWQIFFTALPIGVSLLMMVGHYVYIRKVPDWIKTKHFLYGLLCLMVAVFFFIRGLDDDNDYLRINHGIWHLFIGFSFYFIFLSREKQKKLIVMYLKTLF